MSNGSVPGQAAPRRHTSPLPENGEVVWSNLNANSDMRLYDSSVLQESCDEWGTPTYGQLALNLAEFEHSMLARMSLVGELDEAGRVINGGWNHWRLPGEFPAGPLPFEEVVERAAAALHGQHFLSSVQLRAGNLSVPGERTKILDVVPQPSTYESVRHAVQAKDVRLPHGAFGKAYDVLAMVVGLRPAPLEHNLDLFVPNAGSWISQKDLLRLAHTAMSPRKVEAMQGKIKRLLAEQIETGEPVPGGEVVVEGACALGIDARTELPKVSYEYIGRDSFPAIFAEYSSTQDKEYVKMRAFFEWVTGRPIVLDNGGMAGFGRRRSRAAFIFDQTIS